jgi:proteasome lid subunit RPN8/RPN11
MTKQLRIKITEEDLRETQQYLSADMPRESACFLLVGRRNGSDAEDLLVRRLIEIPKTEYRIQDDYHLDISPRAINGIIALCEANKLGVILCHSHPTISPYSSSDDFGEQRIAQTLWQSLPEVPVGSILMCPRDTVRARIWRKNGTVEPITSLIAVGRSLKKGWLNRITKRPNRQISKIYDRQILAFDVEGQELISRTRVGIVGLGGTGSATAEQLVRLGVEDFVLVDEEDFEPSNLTRIYGSVYADANQRWASSWPRSKRYISKTDLVARHLKQINPKINIRQSKSNIVKSEACKLLLDRDVIFSCTDDHWGRSVLNQIAYQYLIPVINMGVRIDSDSGKIRNAAGTVDILRAGKPCLWCREFLNAERIRAESLPSKERESLLREGYVQGISDRTPSVVSLTTTVSGLAVTSFLQLITDFMGDAGDISRLNYDIMTGTIRRGTGDIKPDCRCLKDKGHGDLKPLDSI